MDFCSTVEILYAALPWRRFRGWLIGAHMERCARCQAGLVSRWQAQRLLVGPDQVGKAADLWRTIAAGLDRERPVCEASPAPPRRAWRWAAAAAMAAAVTLTGFWLLRQVERTEFRAALAAPAGRFEIAYVNVGGEPARTFVYQPQGTDTVFIWASRTP